VKSINRTVKKLDDLRIKEINCKCGNKFKVTDDNIGQDIDGIFTVCKKCKAFHSIE